jgi:hypothetical protein
LAVLAHIDLAWTLRDEEGPLPCCPQS